MSLHVSSHAIIDVMRSHEPVFEIKFGRTLRQIQPIAWDASGGPTDTQDQDMSDDSGDAIVLTAPAGSLLPA